MKCEDKPLIRSRNKKHNICNRLLEMMVSSLTIDLDQDNSRVVPSTYFKETSDKSPAVYHSYQPWGRGMYGMTLPHPTYAQLLTDSSHFVFSSNMVPMILPPRPWINKSNGRSSPCDYLSSLRSNRGLVGNMIMICGQCTATLYLALYHFW